MTRTLAILLMCGACAIAQTKLSAPLVGVARDSAQHLRLVHGVSGSFVLRETISDSVAAWSFDGTTGLMKTPTELWTLGANGEMIRRFPAPAGDAVLGPQSAFFPEAAELWQVGPKGEAKVPVDPAAIAGRVIALGPTKAQATQFAVCRANALWLLSISTTTGAVTRESMPGGAVGEQACLSAGPGSLVLVADRMLLATAHAILIQTAAGAERKIPVSASHASLAGAPVHMIRITSDGEKVYQLPAAKELP